MLKFTLSFLLYFIVLITSSAQEYTSSSIFAHNDYVHPIPFFTAYYQQVGFIEADVFLQQNELMVAHTKEEIEEGKTLEELYFKPLEQKIIKHEGFVYANHTKSLTLMIDLKTEGVATLNELVKQLKKYSKLLSCSTFQIAVSGNVPDRSQWNSYPDFIHFDGRPGIVYTNDQLSRISMISTSFKDHAQWNGKGVLIQSEHEKLKALIDEVHAKGKKIRFWGAPDVVNAWLTWMKLKVDILGTDDVLGLSDFIKSKSKNTFQNVTPHPVYQPKYSYTKSSTPKNVILMIGDGMGLTQLYGGYTSNQGKLNIFNLKDIGFSVTTSSDSYITDSAAGATAMATGNKTKNRYIGVDSSGIALPSITEKLKQRGFKTAIISAGDITDATPAAFYAHQPERSLNEAIANDFISSGNDILIGGGAYAFKNRKDGKNLITTLTQIGYTVSTSFRSLDTIRNKKFVILDDAAVVSKKDGRTDFLTRSLLKSIATFQKQSAPFFIMAEGAQIDYGGHNNDMEYVVREVLDFDQAIGEALKFVDQNGETLLIITADHETGGLTLLDGNISKGYVQGNFSTNDHTAVMVPVFSYGPGSENFKGVYQNTEINRMIAELLKLK
ncbi:MAG: alkaline phosphatase [Chryseolinea sp.]